MNLSKPKNSPARTPIENSLFLGCLFFLILLLLESWGQYAFLTKDTASTQVSQLVTDGLTRCRPDIIRFLMTVFFLYMFAGIAAGGLAHVLARAAAGPSRLFRPVYAVDLVLIPLYLGATMAIFHPQFFAIKPFYRLVPVSWITAHTQPGTFHLLLLIFLLIHAVLLALRYHAWMRTHARSLAAGLAGTLAAGALIAWGEWPPGLGQGPVFRDPRRPHLFFYCIDALRKDRLQRYGYPRAITPNLDAFARESIFFENVHTPMAKTYPSWVSFLTSTGLLTHGVRWANPARERRNVHLPTIVQVLDQRGYLTSFDTDDSRYSYMEDWSGFQSIHQPEPGFMNFFSEYCYYYLLVGKLANTRIGNFLFPMTRNNHALTFTYTPRIFYQDYQAHIGHWVRKGPLASFTHNVGIHYPGAAPWPYYALFTDPEYQGVNKYMYQVYYLEDVAKDEAAENRVDSNDHKQALYDGMVKMMDDKFGEFIRTLKELGIYEDSLIVVFSDHGEHFNEKHPIFRYIIPMHGVSLMDDFANRCFLAIKPPQSLKSRVKVWTVPELARIQDLTPTALDMLGLPLPPSFEGVSFWPRLQNQAPPLDLSIYMERDINPGFLLEPGGLMLNISFLDLFRLDDGARTLGVIEDFAPQILYIKDRALRTNQWKLVRIPKMAGPEYRLFDPNQDPHQLVNLAPTHPQALKEMIQKIEPYLQADGDILKQDAQAMGVRELPLPPGLAGRVQPDANERRQLE